MSFSLACLFNNTVPLLFQASDVLAVELLQKDARLSVSGDLGRQCPGGT
jgi:phosphoenolpyruvate carboxylase